MNTTTAVVISTSKKIHLNDCPKARNSKPATLAAFDAASSANCCKLSPVQLAEIREHLAAAEVTEPAAVAADHQDDAITAAETPETTDAPQTETTLETADTAGPSEVVLALVKAITDLGGDIDLMELADAHPGDEGDRLMAAYADAKDAGLLISIKADEATRLIVTDAGYTAIGHEVAPTPASADKPATPKTRNVAGKLFDPAGRDVTTYPGLVRARRARATGAIVITVRTADSDLDLDKALGKYAAICVTHNKLTYTDVRRAANYKIPVPHTFCDGCAEAVKTTAEK